MPKDKNPAGEGTSGTSTKGAAKHPKTQQNPPTTSSGLSTTQLFILVLIASIGFNCYVSWSKSNKEESSTSPTDSGSSSKRVKELEKELKVANAELDEIKKDQIEVEKMFSISRIVEIARKSKPKVRFASNETKADEISTIAKAVVQQTFHSCTKNIPVGKYDEYKNCFRDLAIELHNRLEQKFPESHFFVCAGRLSYSFMVTTMHSKRQEYFISLGEILFELLEYDDLVTNTPDPVPEELPPIDTGVEDELIEEKVQINVNQDSNKKKL